jgi:ribosome-binding protein aMBF1 (putative translation factor)
MKARTLKDYKAQQMKKPGFKKAWAELDAEFELLESMLQLREQTGITQQCLAEKIGTKQPALSRLERGGFKKASVETLRKIADALDARLVVRLEPKH